MSQWKEFRIEELGELLNSKRVPLSSTQRATRKGEYPYYGASGIVDYLDDFIFDGEHVLISEDGENLRTRKTPVAFIANGKFWVNNHAPILRCKTDYLSKLVVYFFSHLDLNEYITGAVQPKLNKSSLCSIPIPLPKDSREQRAIASVLSSLGDKIDLLHRQNKTLEAMAETLFRQWFVEEAKDDWEEVPLREVCHIQNGYAFQSPTYVEQGTRIIRTMNFANHWIELTDLVYISQELARSHEKFYLRRNDFLLVMVGASLGNFALVTNDVLPSLQNQNMWAFRANTIIDQHYLNFAIRQIVNEILFGASGSAREFFQKGVFYELGIRLPPSALLKKFASFAESTFSRIELNRFQLQSLEKLRDNLLPKLMSGEVRVQYE